MNLTALRIWHIVPVAGLIGAVILLFTSGPAQSYSLFVVAGLIFTAEDYWQPERPLYLGNPLLLLIMVLIFWPLRMLVAFREQVQTLPKRFFVSPRGEEGKVLYFASRAAATVFAAKSAKPGDHVFVFDRLTAEFRFGQLGSKMYVFEIVPDGEPKLISGERSLGIRIRYTLKLIAGLAFLVFALGLLVLAFTHTGSLVLQALAVVLLGLPSLAALRSIPKEMRALILIWQSDEPEDLTELLGDLRSRRGGRL